MQRSFLKELTPAAASNAITGFALGAGGALYLFACIALGLVEILLGKPLPELHPWGTASPAIVAFSGVTLALLAAIAFVDRWAKAAGRLLAVHWVVAFIFTSLAAFGHASETLVWVPGTKTALFAMAALVLADRTTTKSRDGFQTALRTVFGLTLLFYGLIHIFNRDLIAELIPHWLPARSFWPWVTGSLLAAAGLILLTGQAVRLTALAVATMFGSWILVVHLQRIATNPFSSFEWTFALSALALSGVALFVAAGSPEEDRGDHKNLIAGTLPRPEDCGASPGAEGC